jgi:hypothetical protein
MVASAIGAVVGIGGAILGSKAQKKGIQSASDTSLAVAQGNNALARDFYGQNKDILSPYVGRGNAAGDAYNALLGLPTYQQPQQSATVNALNPSASQLAYGGDYSGWFPNLQQIGQQQAQTAVTGTPTAPDYNKAFDQYRNSTGFQFRQNEGMNALGANWLARGLGNSGAAQKSAMAYNQNLGSGEFGNYMNYLGNQSAQGLSAAGALAGVGTNYVNTVSANNNSAGTAAANAALMKGQSSANMYGGIAGALGGIFGSSF